MLVDTLVPASLQMRAAQLSKGNPRRPSTTRCSVVATGVKWLATPAESGREGERAPGAAQEKDAKTLRVQTRRR